MGFMALHEMTDELRHTAGGSGVSLPRLRRFVNAGYFEVAALEDFRALRVTLPITLVADTRNYLLPGGFLAERALRNRTTGQRLVWEPDDTFARYSETEPGIPTRYTITSELLIFPNPGVESDGNQLSLSYTKEPTVLSTSNSISSLPGAYDMAIVAFAKFYYLLNLGQDQAARSWWLKGNSMIKDQRGYLRRMGDRTSSPARIITSESGLYDTG